MKRANGEPHAAGPSEKRSNDGSVGPSRPYQPSLKVRLELVIDNLKEYVGVLKGPDATVGKSGWSLRAGVKTENGSDSLAVYLHCESPEYDWRLKVDYTASVVGSAVQKAERGVKIGQKSQDACVFSEKKQDLLDPAKDYVTDGAFKMEVEVTIYEPYRMLLDFFTADSNYNADVVLRVQDRRFHVNKAHLGYESPVFYQMFFGPYVENSCEEIALEELDSNGFLQFLGAIHRMRAPITNDTVENLVKVADRFEVDWLLRNCEEFLLGYYCNLTVVEKLILSTKVNLDELQVTNRKGSVSLAVNIRCKSAEDEWRLKMDYTASVVGSAVQKANRGVRMANGNFDNEQCMLSEKKQVLLDPANDYLTEGTFKMEAVVTISEPCLMLVDFFTVDSNYNADVVLRVQDRRFYVNKATKCMRQLTLSDVNELIGMSKESAMGVKLNGCLLQELFGKQKELMEYKHKHQNDHVEWKHKEATQVREDEHKSEMDKLKAKMCTRCRK